VLAAHDDLYRVLSRAVADRRTVQRQEVTLANAEGERLLGLSVHPLRRNDGSIRAYLVLFADLTETRRQAEAERLATSLEQVGEMAAGVAHEMRNSLATFRGYLTLIDRAPHDAAIAEHLTELRRETDHLHRVLEDFLSFAKPGSMRLERTDLASLVERTLRDPLLERHAIAVRARPVLVDGDPALLERAVRNLLLNAIQATRGTPDPEPITVDVTSEDRYAVLRIADRGPGLPANLRGALFQPFVTGRADGVGLGLALAHRIVQLHGGRLDLSDRPDGGAQATVEVPLADAPDHRPDDQSR
jgi:signal transduction histidine kinase